MNKAKEIISKRPARKIRSKKGFIPVNDKICSLCQYHSTYGGGTTNVMCNYAAITGELRMVTKNGLRGPKGTCDKFTKGPIISQRAKFTL